MIRSSILALTAACLFTVTASAAPVFFLLGDHPDGALYEGPDSAYGLRLDRGNKLPQLGNEKTLFSAGENLDGGGGPLFLTWDDADLGAGASIFGQILNHNDDSIWEVSFDLFGVAAAANGGITATGANGTLSYNGDVVSLMGKQDDSGLAFIFDNDGHRLDTDSGWVGRGWVKVWLENKQKWSGKGTNDWLVVGVPSPPPPGEEVPEPATVTLMLVGLGALIARRRARKQP